MSATVAMMLRALHPPAREWTGNFGAGEAPASAYDFVKRHEFTQLETTPWVFNSARRMRVVCMQCIALRRTTMHGDAVLTSWNALTATRAFRVCHALHSDC
jgi:hypothetical protein